MHAEGSLVLRQLLEAVDYLHSRWVMSRDLKLPNLLLTGDGRLKICDFGLARYFHAFEEPYTPRVVTLWYRCAANTLQGPACIHRLSSLKQLPFMALRAALFPWLVRHAPPFHRHICCRLRQQDGGTPSARQLCQVQ